MEKITQLPVTSLEDTNLRLKTKSELRRLIKQLTAERDLAVTYYSRLKERLDTGNVMLAVLLKKLGGQAVVTHPDMAAIVRTRIHSSTLGDVMNLSLVEAEEPTDEVETPAEL